MSATPWVRAPRATRAVDGDDEWDAPPSILVERALGFGVPDIEMDGDEGEAPGQPTGNVRLLDARYERPSPPEAVPDIGVGQPPAGERSASLPTSPTDQEGLYRGVLWVAWAVEECSRGFTRLSARLGNVERRLDLLAPERMQARPPVFDVDRVDASPEPDEDVRTELHQLEATFDESRMEVRRRIDGLEERLRQLDFVPLKVSNLQRTVDQLAAALRKWAVAEPAGSQKTDSLDAELQGLRQELAATNRRLAELDARLGVQPVPAVVQAEVRRHAERLAAQAPPAAVDVEGVYRELDAVAEFVAARAAATAEGLERIAPLEVAVLELRRDLRRALVDLAAAQSGSTVEPRLQEVEARLRSLEASGRKVDRLYSALEDAVDSRHRQAEGGGHAVEPAAATRASHGGEASA